MTTITRKRIGWRDLIWVTWRQHRLIIVATTLVALAASVAIALWTAGINPNVTALYLYDFWADQMPYAPTVLGVLVAVFWAAPLVSREYEKQTHILAWSQDASPRQWLTGKVVVLLVLAVALTAVLGAVAADLVQTVAAMNDTMVPILSFRPKSFEANAFLQIGYTLFGFALGLAFSVLTRQTILAMGSTLVVFVGARMFIAEFVRPYFRTPVHSFSPWTPSGQEYVVQRPFHALPVASGYADAAGNAMGVPELCSGPQILDYTACVKANGVAGHYVDYQPVERLPAFQWIETGIFALIAAGLFVFAFIWVRRRRKV